MTMYHVTVGGEVKPTGSLAMSVRRGAEAWQFFVAAFASAMTLAWMLIDEIPAEHWGWRTIAKVVAFFGLAYLTLVNTWIRNRLVGLYSVLKNAERYRG
jgi:hypothetical protein